MALTVAGHADQSPLRQHRWARRWPARGEQVQLFFYTVLLPVDLVAVVAAFASADLVQSSLAGSVVEAESAAPVSVFLMLAPLSLGMFALVGLYKEAGVRSRWDELGKIFVALSGAAMMLVVADAVSTKPLFPSELPVYGYALSLLFVVIARQTVHAAKRALFARDLGVHRAVIVGSGPVAQRIAEFLSASSSGYRVVALVDAGNANSVVSGLPVYRDLATAHGDLAGRVDELIQADSTLPQEELVDILRFANEHQLTYRFVPHQFGLYSENTVVGSIAGIPVVKIRVTPLEGWGRVFKRSFDILASGAGLLLLLPVLAFVALLIAVRDPGPILFRQERVGKAGRLFLILKFRTMQIQHSGRPPLEVFRELGRDDLVAEFLVEQKVKDDPRVSPLGAFLRKTSLDELPQLWNVLKGELSLVGPRPIVLDELPKFGDSRATILALKPGVTGLWQVSGRNDIEYGERVRLNIEYVENWSPRLDLLILLRTVLLVLRGGGAY